jgi:hypothetical protein
MSHYFIVLQLIGTKYSSDKNLIIFKYLYHAYMNFKKNTFVSWWIIGLLGEKAYVTYSIFFKVHVCMIQVFEYNKIFVWAVFSANQL